MNILLFDVEISPLTVYTWGLFNQNHSIDKIIDSSYVLCWAAKWLGSDEVMFDSIQKSGHTKMLKSLHKLLDKADVVIHYNGTRFDVPVVNKEFLLKKLPPPAPFQQIDLLKVARQKFRFPSNKLDYVSKALGLKGKTTHPGFKLWIDCMSGSKDAWKLMETYNKNDVVLLEQVYHKLLPWIKNHPNHGLYSGTVSCPSCGSTHLNKRGFHYTSTVKYQRYQCKACNSWSKSKTGINVKEGLTPA